jgi:hypothetical protein
VLQRTRRGWNEKRRAASASTPLHRDGIRVRNEHCRFERWAAYFISAVMREKVICKVNAVEFVAVSAADDGDVAYFRVCVGAAA